MTRLDQTRGNETEVELTAKGGIPCKAIREDGYWRLEGEIPLPRKNQFRHLRDARSYVRSLATN